MADELDPHREVTFLVHSLRRTIEDRPPSSVGRISTIQWRRTLLALEEVRVILRQAVRQSRSRSLDVSLAEEAHQKLAAMASDTEIMDTISSMKLSLFLASPRERQMFDKYRGITAVDALFVATDLSATIYRPTGQQILDLGNTEELRQLARVVPAQKISPAKFGIDNGRIFLVAQNHEAPTNDANNVGAARAHLRQSGEKIIEALRASNCDRRLIEGLESLQASLAEPSNVIELGLTNIGCEAMCGMASAELPDAICGMLRGHTTAVGMFVAQFPEWQRFSENAAAIELTPADVKEINRAASQIISRIQDRPDIADDEVPRTIRAIRSLTADSSTTVKKAAFALLRTIENFVATVFSFGADFIGKSATKTSEALSDAVARAAIVVLMSAAVAGVGQMTGVTGKIAEASWMKTAVEIVQRQLSGTE